MTREQEQQRKNLPQAELDDGQHSDLSPKQQVDQLLPVDLTDVPPLETLLNADIPLHPVGEPHTGLLTSKNLATVSKPNQRILGVWLQGIDPTVGERGRVMPHDHGSDNITEIIITYDDSVYAGLPDPIEIINNKFSVHLVPPGLTHGSQNQPSFGSWISIKYRT